jgi:hypothetical protein
LFGCELCLDELGFFLYDDRGFWGLGWFVDFYLLSRDLIRFFWLDIFGIIVAINLWWTDKAKQLYCFGILCHLLLNRVNKAK